MNAHDLHTKCPINKNVEHPPPRMFIDLRKAIMNIWNKFLDKRIWASHILVCTYFLMNLQYIYTNLYFSG